MSCNCAGDEINGPLTKAAIVLTKNDLYRLRTGKVIRHHFHGSNLEQGKITFLVSNEKSKVAYNSKLGKEAVLTGDGVPITLTKEELAQLPNGKVIQFTIEKTPPVELTIIHSQTYHAVVKKQNELAEEKLEESNPYHMEHVRDFLKYARWEIIEEYDRQRSNN